MDPELTRLVVVAPTALLLATVPRGHKGALYRGLGVFVAVGISASADPTASAAIIALLASAAAVLISYLDGRRRIVTAVAVALALGLLSAILVDADATWDAISDVVASPRVWTTVCGALLAVFFGGAVIGEVMHPLARKVRSEGQIGMENAGRYIGWLERLLLYALVLAGVPQAAALVVAAKAVARFPEFKQEDFAEYFLIGTLLSLVIAAACAVAVRALLGLSPLLMAG